MPFAGGAHRDLNYRLVTASEEPDSFAPLLAVQPLAGDSCKLSHSYVARHRAAIA
jgi:hypothetical protein